MSTNSNESSDSECEGLEEPTPCDPQEIKRQFLDFYNFLTTLHFDKNDLKVPPPEGWLHLTLEFCAHFKADHTIEVLRNLLYFDQRTKVHIHRGSTVLDYTTFTREDFENAVKEYEFEDKYWGTEGEIDPKHVFLISLGGEQGTYNLFLNARDGEINYEQIGVYEGDHPIQHYFDSLKDMYRKLELIGLPNRRIIDTWGVPEPEHTISLEEVCEESEQFPTNLDKQFLRQLFREHGWPDAFCKHDAVEAVNNMIDAIERSGRACASWKL